MIKSIQIIIVHLMINLPCFAQVRGDEDAGILIAGRRTLLLHPEQVTGKELMQL